MFRQQSMAGSGNVAVIEISDAVNATKSKMARIIPEKGMNYKRREVAGYRKAGRTQDVSYDSSSIDLEMPNGRHRGVVFIPDDPKRQFRVKYSIIPEGLHPAYRGLENAIAGNEIKAFVMYAVPDGMQKSSVPMPKIYDGHRREVNYRKK